MARWVWKDALPDNDMRKAVAIMNKGVLAFLIAFLLQSTVVSAQKVAQMVINMPIDSLTNKVSYAIIYNVYNRLTSDIMRYAEGYCKKEGLPFSIDTASRLVKAQRSFPFKGFKRTCFHHGQITADLLMYAKDGRTKVELTNITFTGDGRCGSSGSLEELLRCSECKSFIDFNTWLYNNLVRAAEEYHDYLKSAVRNPRDW